MIQLDHGHKFDPDTGILVCCSNGGLFANFYHAIWSIIDLKNEGFVARRLDFSSGFKFFRGEDAGDLFPLFFKIDQDSIDKWAKYVPIGKRIPRIDHHGVYSLYPYSVLSLILNAYFQSSDSVESCYRSMLEKYELEDKKFLALYIRGTDKSTEVKLPDLDRVLKAVNTLQKRGQYEKVLLQTDDSQILHYLSNRLNDPVVMEELPVIGGTKGFHYANLEKPIIDPIEFSKRLIAMTRVLALAESLVLPSSNLAGWVCLLRENANNVYQFNKHGHLITPVYRRLFAVKNSLRYIRSKVRGDRHYYV